MKWTNSKEGELDIVELRDSKYGAIGYIRETRRSPNPKQCTWEVEFSAEDLELYWNEVYTGTGEMARVRLLELAQTYLTSKIDELSKLREELKKEMQVIKS